ncbi:unnamed protein product [Adineta ricciae]|uniref:HAT C-terminal dimerisation domain-containing protein n=1 Tax=Adineta ricciae TaxID=249248 RepID=A0A815XG60_ADIRI|nr:unnamed protein product [Adineta ricciae]
MQISSLIPSYISDIQSSDVSPLFHHYQDDLQANDTNIHKAEFDTWRFSILRLKENERPNKIIETLEFIQSIKFFYPNIYILLQIYALIPVSVASAERSFSVLKLIKTKLRNRTDDERLSNLAVINIHKGIAQELNIENVIDEYAKSKRKLNFSNQDK